MWLQGRGSAGGISLSLSYESLVRLRRRYTPLLLEEGVTLVCRKQCLLAATLPVAKWHHEAADTLRECSRVALGTACYGE